MPLDTVTIEPGVLTLSGAILPVEADIVNISPGILRLVGRSANYVPKHFFYFSSYFLALMKKRRKRNGY